MITKKNIQAILIVLTTALLYWILPWAIKLMTNEALDYPFTYYSSINNQFIQTVFDGKEMKRVDLEGREYNQDEYDSIVPMFNYRQLMQDGRLPDTIKGVAINPKQIQLNQFFFRCTPRNYNSCSVNLYPMYESMSGRVSLESPDDLFSIDHRIRFYEAETNKLKQDKNRLFQTAMEKRGFQFPVQWIAGNPSARKPYDEGWFMLDADGQLFQVKMVNGKPFVKNTKAGEKIDIVWMKTIETANHRLYGFVFDRQQNVYFLSDVNYELVKLPIDSFDLKKDRMLIMANLFYWNVTVTRPHQRDLYILDNNDLNRVDEHTEFHEPNQWEKIQPWIFPCYIELKSYHSTYIFPRFIGWSAKALLTNGLAAILMIGLLWWRKKQRFSLIQLAYIMLTGVIGAIAVWCFKEKQQETKNIIQLK